MPETKHIDTTASIVHAVEDQVRGTNELLHSRPAADIATAFWEMRESFRLVEQRHSKPIGGP
jgi:hypothetical protein